MEVLYWDARVEGSKKVYFGEREIDSNDVKWGKQNGTCELCRTVNKALNIIDDGLNDWYFHRKLWNLCKFNGAVDVVRPVDRWIFLFK